MNSRWRLCLDQSSSTLFFSHSPVVSRGPLWQSGSDLLHSNNLVVMSSYKWPQICGWAVVADEQLLWLLHILPTFSQDWCFSLGLAALGLSPRTGEGAQISPVAPPALMQHKVIVGRSAHGIKHIGFVWDLELWGRKRYRVMKCCNLFYVSLLYVLILQSMINDDDNSQNDLESNFRHFKSTSKECLHHWKRGKRNKSKSCFPAEKTWVVFLQITTSNGSFALHSLWKAAAVKEPVYTVYTKMLNRKKEHRGMTSAYWAQSYRNLVFNSILFWAS